MKYDNEIGSYAYFRECGHSKIKALRRSISFRIDRMIPFPIPVHFCIPPEYNIDMALKGLDKQLNYFLEFGYNPNDPTPKRERNTPKGQIERLYLVLQEMPIEYFNERTTGEYQRLEEKIRKLQQEGRLLHF